jgi:signal transduction histidine kinase
MFIDKDTNKLSPKTEHKVSDKVNEILIDVDRISDLMTDILTMGKVEASRVPFNPSIVSMVEFIEEYLHFEAPRIFHARKYNYVNEALNAQINIDRKLMKQVLQNALSNAVKYSPANSVVDITIKEEKGKVSIVVSDHGIGIPEKDLPFVFESFFRAANAENIPGTGLGMPIIRLFTEMNRGEVALESVQNKGTSLIITLPMV